MASSESYIPAGTRAPLSEDKPQGPKRLSRTSIVGIAMTLVTGAAAFAIAVASLSLYKQTHRTKHAVGKYSWYNCYALHSATAKYLDTISIILTFIAASTASVFGGCPCCCSIRNYKKNLAFNLSLVFLVLTWLCFGLALVFKLFSIGTNIYPEGCGGMYPEQLVAVLLTGFFGAGHILTAQMSWIRQLMAPSAVDAPPSVGVPVPVAFAGSDTTATM